MTEVVVAVYKTAHAAETAVADLASARVPATKIRQFASNPTRDQELFELRDLRTARGDRAVAVLVEDNHADVVRDILNMQEPAVLTEAPSMPLEENRGL